MNINSSLVSILWRFCPKASINNNPSLHCRINHSLVSPLFTLNTSLERYQNVLVRKRRHTCLQYLRCLVNYPKPNLGSLTSMACHHYWQGLEKKLGVTAHSTWLHSGIHFNAFKQLSNGSSGLRIIERHLNCVKWLIADHRSCLKPTELCV